MRSTLLRALGILAIGCAVLAGAARADDLSEINRLFSSGHSNDAFTRRFLKGVLLAESQRHAEAAAVFEQLNSDYPDMPEPYNNLAVIYAAQGQYDQARAALEAALRAQPNYAVAHQNLGDIYVQLARLSYAQALKLDAGNAAIPPKLALLREIVKPVAPASTPATK